MISNFIVALYLISIQGLILNNLYNNSNVNTNNNTNRNSYSSFNNANKNTNNNNYNNNNIGIKSDSKIPDYEIDDFLKGEDLSKKNNKKFFIY
jgi:E3 ubiquitin-protein ligase RNF115/126